MSVETVKGKAIGNRDATPVVPTVSSIAGGMQHSGFGTAIVSASASVDSYYPLVSVPSNCRVNKMRFQSGAQGTGCTADIGVFVPTQTNPALLALSSGYVAAAAISRQFFASDVDVSAAVSLTEEQNESGTYTMAKQEKELWDALGLASDPGCMLDIGVKLSASAVAGAALALDVGYVI